MKSQVFGQNFDRACLNEQLTEVKKRTEEEKREEGNEKKGERKEGTENEKDEKEQ